MDLQTLAESLKPIILRWIRPRTTWYAATNGSGGALATGDVVVVDTSADLTVTTSTTESDATVAGVVLVGGEDSEVVYVATHGVVDVAVTGAVDRGEGLRQSTSAGKADKVALGSKGVFGIAVEAAAGPGSGSIRAVISVPVMVVSAPA